MLNANIVGNYAFYWNVQLGNLTFTDTTGQVAPLRHGLEIRGLLGASFGNVTGNMLRGGVVVHTDDKYDGDPDFYESAFCTIAGITANFCVGPTHTGLSELQIGFLSSSGDGPLGGTSSAVAITIASPAVISCTAHGLTAGAPVIFTTTGALPEDCRHT